MLLYVHNNSTEYATRQIGHLPLEGLLPFNCSPLDGYFWRAGHVHVDDYTIQEWRQWERILHIFKRSGKLETTLKMLSNSRKRFAGCFFQCKIEQNINRWEKKERKRKPKCHSAASLSFLSIEEKEPHLTREQQMAPWIQFCAICTSVPGFKTNSSPPPSNSGSGRQQHAMCTHREAREMLASSV